MENIKIKLPVWFWIVAVFSMLWNLLGVVSFFMHVFISQEALDALSIAERELYNSYPLWTDIVFAFAVFFGFAGSLGLALKRKWSKMAFIISLIAIVPQMIHNIFYTKTIEVYGAAQAVTMPILVVVFGILLVWFSSFAINKNWLNKVKLIK